MACAFKGRAYSSPKGHPRPQARDGTRSLDTNATSGETIQMSHRPEEQNPAGKLATPFGYKPSVHACVPLEGQEGNFLAANVPSRIAT